MVIDRRRGAAADAFISVRLTHKYAEAIDGVDLSHVDIGDDVRLPLREAALLVAEGWAVQSAPGLNAERRRPRSTPPPCVCGHVGPPPRSIQQPSEPMKV